MILRANQQALARGAMVERCFEATRRISKRHAIPFVFMSYFNLVQRPGVATFVGSIADAGLKGAIVPDLPPEDARDTSRPCRLPSSIRSSSSHRAVPMQGTIVVRPSLQVPLVHVTLCRMSGRVLSVAAMALGALAGCVPSGNASSMGASGDSGGPCDPLAAHELPVTLGSILGVGRNAQGTLYVADEVVASSTDRVFVSDTDTLWRKRVAGSGQSSNGADIDYSLSYEDGANSHALAIRIRGGVTTGMALAPPNSRAFVGDPSVTETLEVLDSSAIDGMTLRNLPGEVSVEYVADVADGHVIVVTRPTDDWTYQDFRVFYGAPEAMLEATLSAVSRTRSGDTTMVFRVGSTSYQATFTVIEEFGDAGYSTSPGPGTLSSSSGAMQSLTERTPSAAQLDGYSFSCLGS